MKRLSTFNEILPEFFDLKGKTVVDIGCANGELVRWMSLQGASVTGIDLPDMIAQAEKIDKTGNEKYLIGTAQEFSFDENMADLIVYMASFHHVPENEMPKALENCYSALKNKGHAIFIEPLAEKDSYYDLTRLVEEETEIREKAFEFIMEAGKTKFRQLIESYYYVERTFQDFLNLLEQFVNDENQREKIIGQAKNIIIQKNIEPDQIKFKSQVRLNILQKND